MRAPVLPLLLAGLTVLTHCTLLGGSGGMTTPANPEIPDDNLCRCGGYSNHLALLRIEEDRGLFLDTTEQDYNARGREYSATLLRVLPANPNHWHFPPLDSPGQRIRVRHYNLRPDGSFHQPPSNPNGRVYQPGMLLLAFVGAREAEVGRVWYFGVLPADTTTGTLIRPWYRFPPGTGPEQVLDPSEWRNLARGCEPPCDNFRFPPDASAPMDVEVSDVVHPDLPPRVPPDGMIPNDAPPG